MFVSVFCELVYFLDFAVNTASPIVGVPSTDESPPDIIASFFWVPGLAVPGVIVYVNVTSGQFSPLP